jgi:L-fuconolactonase
VGWVDLASPDAGRQLDDLARNPNLKGVRHLVESEPDDAWLVRGDVMAGLGEVAARGLTFDLLVHTRHLEHVVALAQRCPDLRMVVDHMAKPPVRGGEVEAWRASIDRVARMPTIWCKLSGLVTEANLSSWTVDDLQPFVEHALDAFGPERMLFGSDYPVCLRAAGYARVLRAFRTLLADLGAGDRERIFSVNAVEFYNLRGESAPGVPGPPDP